MLIAKIGGNVIEDQLALSRFLKDFATWAGPKILVHGGGKSATQLAGRLGVPTEMIDGRRITSVENLDIVLMTYAGLLNKKIVAQLQGYSCDAVGLTGADGDSIRSDKRPVQFVDYGYVGDVKAVNSTYIHSMLDQEKVPIFCAVTHDGNGQLLNTNADTIASKLAQAMGELYTVSLYYCFELEGVLENIKDPDSLVECMDYHTYLHLVDQGRIVNGMLPKLHNCLEALQNKVNEVHIANANYIKDPQVRHTTLTL